MAGVGHLKRICKDAFSVAGAVKETCSSELLGSPGADFLRGVAFWSIRIYHQTPKCNCNGLQRNRLALPPGFSHGLSLRKFPFESLNTQHHQYNIPTCQIHCHWLSLKSMPFPYSMRLMESVLSHRVLYTSIYIYIYMFI